MFYIFSQERDLTGVTNKRGAIDNETYSLLLCRTIFSCSESNEIRQNKGLESIHITVS